MLEVFVENAIKTHLNKYNEYFPNLLYLFWYFFFQLSQNIYSFVAHFLSILAHFILYELDTMGFYSLCILFPSLCFLSPLPCIISPSLYIPSLFYQRTFQLKNSLYFTPLIFVRVCGIHTEPIVTGGQNKNLNVATLQCLSGTDLWLD